MPDYAPLIARIIEQTGIEFRAASPFDVSKLEALGLPQSVLDFYRAYEPSECVESKIRLWPIEHILEENEALVPGCYSCKNGYVVFATTLCGDTYFRYFAWRAHRATHRPYFTRGDQRRDHESGVCPARQASRPEPT